MHYFKKIILYSVLLFLLNNCGFTPTYKMQTNSIINKEIVFEIDNEVSYEIKREIFKNFSKIETENTKYKSNLSISEKETAVTLESDGSVSEYRVEILIEFKVIQIKGGELIYSSQSRGFSNYDILTSEYNNKIARKDALKQSLSQAIDLMNFLINNQIKI